MVACISSVVIVGMQAIRKKVCLCESPSKLPFQDIPSFFDHAVKTWHEESQPAVTVH
jgi:hypothetical protein